MKSGLGALLFNESQQHPLDAPAVGAGDEIGHPVFAQPVLRHFDDDVVGLDPGIVNVTGNALQAGGAGGEQLHFAGESVGA